EGERDRCPFAAFVPSSHTDMSETHTPSPRTQWRRRSTASGWMRSAAPSRYQIQMWVSMRAGPENPARSPGRQTSGMRAIPRLEIGSRQVDRTITHGALQASEGVGDLTVHGNEAR